MDNTLKQRLKRKNRIRKKIFGTPEKPRLSVYRSLRYVYAQLVDDLNGKSLAAASSLGRKSGGGNRMAAEEVGMMIAEKARGLKIGEVKFDRNGFLYHGVVQSLASGARKAGLKF